MKSLRPYLRRFARNDEGGVQAIGFIIVFIPFLAILTAGAELGILQTRQMMLERGLDITVRAIRLNPRQKPDANAIRNMTCDHAGIIPRCRETLKIEMIKQNPHNGMTVPALPDCTDLNNPAAPLRNFVMGQENELMFIRACVLIDPRLMRTLGLGAVLVGNSPTKTYPLVATSAYVVEPS